MPKAHKETNKTTEDKSSFSKKNTFKDKTTEDKSSFSKKNTFKDIQLLKSSEIYPAN